MLNSIHRFEGEGAGHSDSISSTFIPLPLPMMEDEVVGSILKAYVQMEDGAAPPVAFWD